MKKKGHTPITRVKNPEPHISDPDWIIWAAWADRITFEEIEKKTGKTEGEVIKIMRRSIKPVLLDCGEKELIKKVLNIEKNLNTLEKKLLVKLKRMIIYKI